MGIPQQQSNNQLENERLRLEIVQLKESLDKEQFFHKAVYKQWYELNANMLDKERELKQAKAKNLLYKYTFYLILISLPIAYYLQSGGKRDETEAALSKIVSSPSESPNQALAKSSVTVPRAKMSSGKNEVREANEKQPTLATVTKPVLAEKLSDSVWHDVYWEGWTAYYQNSHNPYQKTSEKYQVWLQGWEGGKNETNRLKAKASSETVNSLAGSVTNEKQ